MPYKLNKKKLHKGAYDHSLVDLDINLPSPNVPVPQLSVKGGYACLNSLRQRGFNEDTNAKQFNPLELRIL